VSGIANAAQHRPLSAAVRPRLSGICNAALNIFEFVIQKRINATRAKRHYKCRLIQQIHHPSLIKYWMDNCKLSKDVSGIANAAQRSSKPNLTNYLKKHPLP